MSEIAAGSEAVLAHTMRDRARSAYGASPRSNERGRAMAAEAAATALLGVQSASALPTAKAGGGAATLPPLRGAVPVGAGGSEGSSAGRGLGIDAGRSLPDSARSQEGGGSGGDPARLVRDLQREVSRLRSLEVDLKTQLRSQAGVIAENQAMLEEGRMRVLEVLSTLAREGRSMEGEREAIKRELASLRGASASLERELARVRRESRDREAVAAQDMTRAVQAAKREASETLDRANGATAEAMRQLEAAERAAASARARAEAVEAELSAVRAAATAQADASREGAAARAAAIMSLRKELEVALETSRGEVESARRQLVAASQEAARQRLRAEEAARALEAARLAAASERGDAAQLHAALREAREEVEEVRRQSEAAASRETVARSRVELVLHDMEARLAAASREHAAEVASLVAALEDARAKAAEAAAIAAAAPRAAAADASAAHETAVRLALEHAAASSQAREDELRARLAAQGAAAASELEAAETRRREERDALDQVLSEARAGYASKLAALEARAEVAEAARAEAAADAERARAELSLAQSSAELAAGKTAAATDAQAEAARRLDLAEARAAAAERALAELREEVERNAETTARPAESPPRPRSPSPLARASAAERELVQARALLAGAEGSAKAHQESAGRLGRLLQQRDGELRRLLALLETARGELVNARDASRSGDELRAQLLVAESRATSAEARAVAAADEAARLAAESERARSQAASAKMRADAEKERGQATRLDADRLARENACLKVRAADAEADADRQRRHAALARTAGEHSRGVGPRRSLANAGAAAESSDGSSSPLMDQERVAVARSVAAAAIFSAVSHAEQKPARSTAEVQTGPDRALGVLEGEIGRLQAENADLLAQAATARQLLAASSAAMANGNQQQKLQYFARMKADLENLRSEAALLSRDRFALEQCVRYLSNGANGRLPPGTLPAYLAGAVSSPGQAPPAGGAQVTGRAQERTIDPGRERSPSLGPEASGGVRAPGGGQTAPGARDGSLTGLLPASIDGSEKYYTAGTSLVASATIRARAPAPSPGAAYSRRPEAPQLSSHSEVYDGLEPYAVSKSRPETVSAVELKILRRIAAVLSLGGVSAANARKPASTGPTPRSQLAATQSPAAQAARRAAAGATPAGAATAARAVQRRASEEAARADGREDLFASPRRSPPPGDSASPRSGGPSPRGTGARGTTPPPKRAFR